MGRIFTILCLAVLLLTCVASAEKFLELDKQKYIDSPGFLGYVPDRFIVVLNYDVAVDHSHDLKTSVSLAHLNGFAQLADRFDVTSLRPQFPGSDRGKVSLSAEAQKLARHYKVTISSGELEEAMAAYAELEEVDHVEPIGVHAVTATPNDPYYSDPPGGYAYDQWHYWDTYGVEADLAWDSEAGNNNVVVGVLDLGVKYDHGDLGGSNPPGPNDNSTNGNIWTNPGETPGNGVDDDGNGYVDDIIGWDFVERTDWYSYNCIDLDCGGADNDPWDGDGHGTHVAGTIGAITNNGYSVAGVAGGWGDGTFSGGGNGIKIVPCRVGYVLDYWIYGATGVVVMDYVAEAMYYMADLKQNGNNVAAINCSFGNTNDGGLSSAVDYLLAQDVMIISAAGNGDANDPSYLGSRSDCVDVGATDQSGNPASFSNYGSWVDVAAPGVTILSTSTDPADPSGDYVTVLDGTSMSCPHVVGVAALLEAHNPSLTAQDKWDYIVNNTNPYNQTKDVGVGIVSAKKALDAAGASQNPPVADFSGSPTSGEASLTVNFTDLSTNNPTSWSWDFGDGSGTSTAQNPSYTYNSAGTYTVTLTATNAYGSDIETKVDYISVTEPQPQPPVADFSASPTSGETPLTVDFTDLSTNSPTSWSWDFGDGSGTSTAQNPSYTYNSAGTYTVSLTATNADGSDTETKVDYITVTEPQPQPPVADFSASPTSGEAPLTVNFTDLSSNNPTSWSWDFGDGSGTSTAQNPSYTYDNVGTYTVSLTATNADGSDIETKVDYITVTEAGQDVKDYAIGDIALIGTVSGDYMDTYASDNVYETITEETYTGHPRKRYSYLEHKWSFNISSGTSVNFYLEAYRTANSEGDNFVFEYSTDDATYYSLVTVASATEQIYSVSLPSTLSGTVYVRVTDANRSWGNTVNDAVYIDEMYFQVAASASPPVADFSGSPTTGDYPLAVSFTDLSSGSPTSWSWDFGDGSGTSTAQNPSYTYNSAGTYTVSLTATNAYGSDTETKVDYITVTQPSQDPPVADFSGSPTSGETPLSVDFTDLSTNNPTSWSWDFGDGSGTSTAQNPSYTYNSAGTYTVSLTATNAYGSDTETKVDYITVTEQTGTAVHVQNITVTREVAGGPNRVGVATVTIVDQNNSAVSGATVYGYFSAPDGTTESATTGSNGVATLTSRKTRNPPSDWCFTVTDVVYSGAIYDSGANQVTEACESGWVFGINGLSSTRPDDFGLHQNRPNPFNPVTEISFRLESPTSVRLAIYNITGQRVASLINGIMDAGLHSVTWDGSAYSSGIYFYRLETEYGIESRKMILMK